MACPLVLGTAQLGFHYGVANKTGQPNQSTATAIVQEAWENGICEFDTAQVYGNSEGVLGKALSELGIAREARVISKFNPALNHLSAVAMSDALNESLSRLGVPYLFGTMLHKEEILSLYWIKVYRKYFMTWSHRAGLSIWEFLFIRLIRHYRRWMQTA